MLKQGYSSPEFYQFAEHARPHARPTWRKSLAKQPWLVGDKPTLADLAVLPYVISAEKFGLEMMYRGSPRRDGLAQRWRATPTYDITMPWTLPDEHRAEVMRQSQEPWSQIKSSRVN